MAPIKKTGKPNPARLESHRYREFAEERSHRDAHISNENARAAGQALILINGGAATALIAFLSKDRVSASDLHWLGYCVGLYGAGVFFGAFMVFAMVKSLDWWNVHWRRVAFPYSEGREDANTRAGRWLNVSNSCFILAMTCFLFASVGVGIAMSSIDGWDVSKKQTKSP